jgi:hypothetical protein
MKVTSNTQPSKSRRAGLPAPVPSLIRFQARKDKFPPREASSRPFPWCIDRHLSSPRNLATALGIARFHDSIAHTEPPHIVCDRQHNARQKQRRAKGAAPRSRRRRRGHRAPIKRVPKRTTLPPTIPAPHPPQVIRRKRLDPSKRPSTKQRPLRTTIRRRMCTICAVSERTRPDTSAAGEGESLDTRDTVLSVRHRIGGAVRNGVMVIFEDV